MGEVHTAVTPTRCFPFAKNFKCTSPYGPRKAYKTSGGYSSTDHKGVDLVGIDSKDVIACESGIVKLAQWGNGVGNYIWIATDTGFGNIYQHLDSFSVRVGDHVVAKQKIGVMGNTGNSSGPHLHFGVATNTQFTAYYKNKWINPAIWFGMSERGFYIGSQHNGAGIVKELTDGQVYVTDQTEEEKSKNFTLNINTASGTQQIVASGQYSLLDKMSGVYSDWLYGRRYRIIIDLGNGEAIDISELRCQFSIEKTTYRKVTTSSITIYNLNPNDENRIIKSGKRMIIEAGYNGSFYGKIFEGNIIQPIRSKEGGVDYKLTLISMDSDRFITYGIVGCSLVAQQSSRDAIEAIASKSIVTSEIGILSQTQIKYPRGKVMFGMASRYLDQIAKSENAQYYTDDGKINIVNAETISDGYIFELNPQTGLIGSPSQSEYGIKCSCLLNPMLKLDSLFHIDNRKITGYQYTYGNPVRSLDDEGIYRIITMKYSGDTRGADWKIEIEAIAQAGSLPAMAAGKDVYIF